MGQLVLFESNDPHSFSDVTALADSANKSGVAMKRKVKVQVQNPKLTSNPKQEFDVRHLPV